MFLSLLIKIMPLYAIIALGYLAGKYLNVQKEAVARLLIYILAPVVVFNAIAAANLSPGLLALPVLFFLLGSLLCLVTYQVARVFWKDSTSNLAAFLAGTGNTGYFGLPVAIALFGPGVAGIAVVSTIGLILFESTVGFYITARGRNSVAESLRRVARLPTVYALLLGLAFNVAALKFGPEYDAAASLFIGAYSVLGMLLIGMGLAMITKLNIDIRFLAFTFLGKFAVWPIAAYGIIAADVAFIHLFDPQIHKVMILLAIVPMAVNAVAFATELNARPEKAALAVFLSTIAALFYIPVIVSLVIA